jgi:uncharacterized RDD family membrane protein YckC
MASVERVRDYEVLTPERVMLQYDVAGIGSRSAAALVDVFIQGAVLLTLGVALAFAARLAGISPTELAPGATMLVVSVVGALSVIALFLILWGYYLFFEIVWNGQTPGKRRLGIRVIRENGYPIRPADSAVRNLIRIADGPPLGAVLGLFVMLFNARSKRLGDFAAGTIVVREAPRRDLAAATLSALDEAQPSSPIEAQPGVESGGATPVLGAADATLVRDFLVRRDQLETASRERIAARLADALAARYGLQARRAGASSEVFLERLIDR